MILATALLITNIILFVLETIGYHTCHSVLILLDGYYHLFQAILCAVRIVSRLIQFTYTSRQTYGLARVGVVGELIAFVGFISLSISVFLASIKDIIDIVFVPSKQGTNSSSILDTAPNHAHIHCLVKQSYFFLGVGLYATVSNCLLGIAILYIVMKRSRKFDRQLKQRTPGLKHPLPKKLLSKSLLITDTLSTRHSYIQVVNMLLGPIAILTCGILLILLSDKHHVLILFTPLVDPLICCFLFISYLFMISIPMRDVIHLVLQANPCHLKSNEIEQILCDSVSGISSIHELHIWRLTPQKTLATVHIVFNTTENILTKYEAIHFIFQTLHIHHVTIQPEFVLPTDEIKKLGCHYQCSSNDTECGPLRCCDNSIMNSTS